MCKITCRWLFVLGVPFHSIFARCSLQIKMKVEENLSMVIGYLKTRKSQIVSTTANPPIDTLWSGFACIQIPDFFLISVEPVTIKLLDLHDYWNVSQFSTAPSHSLVTFRMRRHGIPCPSVVTLRKHVLVMSFIGSNQCPATKLKETRLSVVDAQLAYEQCLEVSRRNSQGHS